MSSIFKLPKSIIAVNEGSYSGLQFELKGIRRDIAGYQRELTVFKKETDAEVASRETKLAKMLPIFQGHRVRLITQRFEHVHSMPSHFVVVHKAAFTRSRFSLVYAASQTAYT